MIKSHEDVAAMIPWYANGTLAKEERAAIEFHVRQCSDCRALLDEARLLMTEGLDSERLADGIGSAEGIGPGRAIGTAGTSLPDVLAGHPQAQILREFAERSAALGEETADAVRVHLANCEACRTAVEATKAAIEIEGDSPSAAANDAGRTTVPPLHASPGRSGAAPAGGIWAWLSGTLLQPVPAAAYLLLLLIAMPMVLLQRPTSTGRSTQPAGDLAAPSFLPPPMTITGERTFRQRPDEGPAPLAIDLPREPGAMVHLALKTRIDREDLDDPGAAFEVFIERRNEVLWSKTTGGSSFSADRELRLLLPSGLLRGDPATIAIRFFKPGDPLHGADLFRRTIIAR